MHSHNPNPEKNPLEFELNWLKTEGDVDQNTCFNERVYGTKTLIRSKWHTLM